MKRPDPATYKSWSNDELIRTATIDKKDYLPEALALIITELGKRGVSHDDIDEIANNQAAVDKDDRINKLTGVGGWLLFFTTLIIISVTYTFANTVVWYANDPTTGWLIVPELALALYGSYVLFLLFAWRSTAPKHAAWWMVSLLVYNLFSLWLLYAETKTIEVFVFAVRPFLFAAIWLVYLKRSKRVFFTYRTNNPLI